MTTSPKTSERGPYFFGTETNLWITQTSDLQPDYPGPTAVRFSEVFFYKPLTLAMLLFKKKLYCSANVIKTFVKNNVLQYIYFYSVMC